MDGLLYRTLSEGICKKIALVSSSFDRRRMDRSSWWTGACYSVFGKRWETFHLNAEKEHRRQFSRSEPCNGVNGWVYRGLIKNKTNAYYKPCEHTNCHTHKLSHVSTVNAADSLGAWMLLSTAAPEFGPDRLLKFVQQRM